MSALPVRLADLRLDRLLRCGTRGDDARLLCVLGLELGAGACDVGAEVLDLREDRRVLGGDRLRAVDARDHVVEALRTEDHLERGLLVRRVERDEALRDRALARAQVVLRDAELHAVLLQVVLDLRELCGGSVVLRPRALERVRELLELRLDLLGLGALGGDRWVRKGRDCREERQTQTDGCEREADGCSRRAANPGQPLR